MERKRFEQIYKNKNKKNQLTVDSLFHKINHGYMCTCAQQFYNYSTNIFGSHRSSDWFKRPMGKKGEGVIETNKRCTYNTSFLQRIKMYLWWTAILYSDRTRNKVIRLKGVNFAMYV